MEERVPGRELYFGFIEDAYEVVKDIHGETEAKRAIAQKALKQKTGARGLRSIMEGILMESMFNLPSYGNIAKVTITKECVTEGTAPVLTDRRNRVVETW